MISIEEAKADVIYKATVVDWDEIQIENGNPYLIKSTLFMPEWAARHFITITDVRAERLQEITEEDAIAEGIEEWEGMFKEYNKPNSNPGWTRNPLLSYHTLWNSINPKYPWESNPWVFPYTFRRLKGGIL